MISQRSASPLRSHRLSDPAPTFDLQSHSLHSDGALPAREVVALAARSGVRLLALSDHDTVDGVAEALAAAGDHDVALVPAVEISTLDSRGQDLHILGYLIDHRDPQLLARLHGYRGARELRADEMSAVLRELGFELEEGVLRVRREQGRSIGRPHLAEAVVAHPANAARLEAEGLADPSAFLVAYLIEGRPAFVPRAAPPVGEAIETIHSAGGVAVWAHPFWDIADPGDVLTTIDRFRGAGLDGVECFYVAHDRDQTQLLADRCAEIGLLSTGSADFHGPEHSRFSRFRAFSTHGRRPALGPIGEPT